MLPNAPSSTESGAPKPLAILTELVKRLLESKRIDRQVMAERLDDTLLGQCGLIELKSFEKKKLRLMTKNM